MNAAVDSTVVATIPPAQRAMQRSGNQFLPQSFGELIKYAEYVASSELVPKDYRNKPANVAVAVQWGMELGMSPLQAVQNIAVINGRPTIWGDMLVALIQAHPEYEDMDESQETDKGVVVGWTVVLKRKGKKPITRSFTKADAVQAGLWSKPGPWQAYPARMLMNRARTFAMRDLFADALRGMTSREEAEDSELIDIPRTDVREVEPSAPTVAMPQPKSAAQSAPAGGAEPAPEAPRDQPKTQEEDRPATPEHNDAGWLLSDSQRRILLARGMSAGLDENELARRWPTITPETLNDVMAEVRKIGEAQQ